MFKTGQSKQTERCLGKREGKREEIDVIDVIDVMGVIREGGEKGGFRPVERFSFLVEF